MNIRSSGQIIETTDLTPIRNIRKDDEAWLRQLAKDVRTDTLTLKLSRGDRDDTEPVVFFDERSGSWWAGRFIGEVQYLGKTLRILPRFGMPQLQRWLSRIWGINILSTKGKYERTSIWLWALIAKLWESRLLSAAKHGPPTSRFDELHYGHTIRGRLQVRLTSDEFSRGRQQLVSRSRNRHIDHRIGGIIVHAFEQLRRELRHLGDERSWLTDRAQNLAKQLCTHITRKEVDVSAQSRAPIRYTPITETYRDVVEMSRAISQRRPFSSTSEGSNDVLGVLIDMAEIWELYIYHLLRSALHDVEVIHTGRDRHTSNYLLRSEQTGDTVGRLKPDILILEFHTNRILAILDAKYKTTTPTPERPHGILREDLYQMAAYLSAFGGPEGRVHGGLVYPATKDTANIVALQSRNPWRFAATERHLWFISLSCQESATTGFQLSNEESAFIETVQKLLIYP